MLDRPYDHSEYPETQKRAEIDAAWALYTSADYAERFRERKRWLEKHLMSQSELCAYCTIVMNETVVAGAEDRRATLDHIIPRSRGGPDILENTVAVCAYCNTAKGSISVDEYKNSVKLLRRVKLALIAPDQLSNDPDSPYYDVRALQRGIGVRFNCKERTDVLEYSVTEAWIRRRAGRSFDKRGKPFTLKFSGDVEAYYSDTALLLKQIGRI
jgi:hypothetical protein